MKLTQRAAAPPSASLSEGTGSCARGSRVDRLTSAMTVAAIRRTVPDQWFAMADRAYGLCDDR